MVIIPVAFILLFLFPIIVVAAFLESFVERKQKGLLVELRKLQALDIPSVSEGWGGEVGIQNEIRSYYSRSSLYIPACLLTFLYGIPFLVCWSYLNVVFFHGSAGLFSKDFIMAARPVMMAFVGVYLFNAGTTIRRLYLSDLTENIFWSGINRLMLTLGLSVVIATAYKLAADPNQEINRYFYFLFFAIGFLANVFLEWVIEVAVRVANIGKPQTPDLPLRMVQGIDMWKEYRLEEEGIENVQNLATADIIELAVKTHYNLRTLLDWIDQAIILDRLGENAEKLRKETLIAGAIDMAWLSPENSGSNETAHKIAGKLNLDEHFVEKFMNGLYGDTFVQTLWRFWQARAETKGSQTN